MEILFKDTVATGFGAWAPSEDLVEEEGGVEANDGLNIETPMTEEREEYEGLEELETDLNPSSQMSKRKRVGTNNKRDSIGHRMCDQFDSIIESFTTEDSTANANVSHIPTLGDCLDMFNVLPGLEYCSETHIIAIRLMKQKSNRETFVLLNDPVLQLSWIKSHTLADVFGH